MWNNPCIHTKERPLLRASATHTHMRHGGFWIEYVFKSPLLVSPLNRSRHSRQGHTQVGCPCMASKLFTLRIRSYIIRTTATALTDLTSSFSQCWYPTTATQLWYPTTAQHQQEHSKAFTIMSPRTVGSCSIPSGNALCYMSHPPLVWLASSFGLVQL